METRTAVGTEQPGPPSSPDTDALTYLPMNKPTLQIARFENGLAKR